MRMWGIFLVKVENSTFSSRIEAPFLKKGIQSKGVEPGVGTPAPPSVLALWWRATSDCKYILTSYKNLSFHFHKLNHAMKKPLGPLCNSLKLEVIKIGKHLNIFIKSFQNTQMSIKKMNSHFPRL